MVRDGPSSPGGFSMASAKSSTASGAKLGRPLPHWLAWFVTFMFINAAWVFFRAKDWAESIRILKGMPGALRNNTFRDNDTLLPILLLIVIFLPIVVFTPNSSEKMETLRPTWRTALFIAILFIVSLLYFNRISEFLKHFNF